MGEVKPAGEGLGANEQVDFAGLDGLIEMGEISTFLIIPVEAGDFGLRKKAAKFGFEELSAETFMDDVGMLAIGATRGDFFFVTTDMTGERIAIGVESHGEIAFRAESLPAATFADGERG